MAVQSRRDAVADRDKRQLLHELTWFVPTVSAIVFAVKVSLTDTSPTVPNVIAFASAAVIATLTILMQRIGALNLTGRSGVAIAGISVLLTGVLLTQTVFWPKPWNMDDPEVYFAKKQINVGMTMDVAPWNSATTGFENDLLAYIAAELDVTFKPYRITSKERDEVLQPDSGRDIDMVISNFTISPARAATMDFAGPYYLDTTGVWKNLEKFGTDGKSWQGLEPPAVCAVQGTTGNSAMQSFLASPQGEGVTAKVGYTASADCLKDLFDLNSAVGYAATDWSILKAYKSDAKIGDGNRDHPNIDAEGRVLNGDPGLAGWDAVDSPQFYGVAIRHGNPVTCKRLTEVISSFVTQVANSDRGFAPAYTTNLFPKLGPVADDWHKPRMESLDWGGKPSPVCASASRAQR